ncbi:MAG: hypothetical protein PHW69_09915, partial [Elusimicrobiaceae bacterium]|nr:hypothetical protein [Elusimicrobiaceae bacterium]
RALDSGIFTAVSSDKKAACDSLETCSTELGFALDLLKARKSSISEAERKILLPQLTGLMEETQRALAKIGKGLYLDTDNQTLIILTLAEISKRELTTFGSDDFDTDLPPFTNDDSR